MPPRGCRSTSSSTSAVEVYEQPAPAAARYAVARIARRGEEIRLVEFPDLSPAADHLLPVAPSDTVGP